VRPIFIPRKSEIRLLVRCTYESEDR